jgi:hypothetical protein
MAYINRITDAELQRKLQAAGAILIRGAKACGKTESAKQIAKSILEVDTDPQVPLFMGTSPNRLLIGNPPRLINLLNLPYLPCSSHRKRKLHCIHCVCLFQIKYPN